MPSKDNIRHGFNRPGRAPVRPAGGAGLASRVMPRCNTRAGKIGSGRGTKRLDPLWTPLLLWRYSHSTPPSGSYRPRRRDHGVRDKMLAYIAADDRFLGLNRGDWAVLFAASTLIVAATFLFT